MQMRDLKMQKVDLKMHLSMIFACQMVVKMHLFVLICVRFGL